MWQNEENIHTKKNQKKKKTELGITLRITLIKEDKINCDQGLKKPDLLLTKAAS